MTRRNGIGTISVVIGIIVVILIATVAFVLYSPASTSHGDSPTVIATNTSICISPGQPLGAFVRVLNASTLTPVLGAEVTASRNTSTSCGGEAFTTVQETFTTNATEWYSLSTLNGGTYQIMVTYLSHAYNLTLPLGLSIFNCGTLYLPSGQTNVTTSTQASCAGTSAPASYRSGPISTYPAAWGIFSSCPGFSTEGNATTLPLTPVAYPDSWNTTTIVTLNQVYESIIDSSAFAGIASGHGWVVYSWSFMQGGSTTVPPNSDDIVGYFILTNGFSPDGYVTAYYDIQDGSTAVSSVATTVTVNCPTTASSTYTEPPTQTNFTASSLSGLELRLELNATTISVGGAISAQLTLFNTLGQNLSLTPNFQNSSLPGWGEYADICGDSDDVPIIGYALFQGYYDQNNISIAGSPLRLAPSVPLPCATWPDPSSVVFLPNGDTAEVYGTGGGGVVQQITKGASTEYCTWDGSGGSCGPLGDALSGYWNSSGLITQQQATLDSPYLAHFLPGYYTLVAEDAWGQTIYAHFLVVPSS